MARIALIGADEGVMACLEAAAAGHQMVECDHAAAAQDADVLVVDCSAAPAAAVDGLDGVTGAGVPVLVVADRRAVVAEALRTRAGVTVLRKPLDPLELATALRRALDAGASARPAAAAESKSSQPDWSSPPLVPASVCATMHAALAVPAALWIIGEPGGGALRLAGLLAGRYRPTRPTLCWRIGESFDALEARAAAGAALPPSAHVLLAPDVESRPLADQARLEELLELHPEALVIATSGDDPGSAVLDGTFSRSLCRLLERWAVRLPALRHRQADIADIARTLAEALAPACCGGAAVSFTEAALRKLAAYPWPGNLIELEGAVARSLVAAGQARSGAGDQSDELSPLSIDAADLHIAPALIGDGPTAPASVARRAAVVVPIGAGGPRVAEGSNAAVAPTQAVSDPAAIESVLAGLAHDLRNPMTTLKTFAELAARAAGEESDSPSLAEEAVAACARIDAPLELLRRYGSLEEAQPARLDLVALFADAIEEAPLPVEAVVAATRPRPSRIDPYRARFVAAAILEEARARLGTGGQARVEVADADSALEVRIAGAGAAVDRLDRWLAAEALPWRLALAREVARREGGDLEVRTGQDETCVRWLAPPAEEQSDGQADRVDRRRRSRSS